VKEIYYSTVLIKYYIQDTDVGQQQQMFITELTVYKYSVLNLITFVLICV